MEIRVKSKKARTILLGIMGIIGLTLILLYLFSDVFSKNDQKKQLPIINHLANDRPVVFGDNKEFVLANRHVMAVIGKNYLANFVYNYDNRADRQEQSWFRKDGAKAVVEIYQLPKMKKVKEIDLYDIVESYNDDYGISDIDQIVYKDTDYLILYLAKAKTKEFPYIAPEFKPVLFDIKTETISDLPSELFNVGTSVGTNILRYYEHYTDAISRTTLRARIEGYGFNSHKGPVLYHIPDSYSEDESYFLDKASPINLFKEHPDFAKRMYTRKMTDDNVWSKAEAIYARPGLVSDEEWFNTLLHWFSESETEDLTVYPLDSEGNPIESVPIKSYADYQAWQAAHPDSK